MTHCQLLVVEIWTSRVVQWHLSNGYRLRLTPPVCHVTSDTEDSESCQVAHFGYYWVTQPCSCQWNSLELSPRILPTSAKSLPMPKACWIHKAWYIDKWLILAKLLFLLYIQFFGNKITTQELGTQDTYTGAWGHSLCHEKLAFMKFSMKKHDILLVAIIARQAERICWQERSDASKLSWLLSER